MQLHTLLPLIIYLGTATAVPLGGDEPGAGAGSEGRTGLEALGNAKIFGAPKMFMKGPFSKRGEGKSGEDDDCDDDDQAEDDQNEARAFDETLTELMERGKGSDLLGAAASVGTAVSGVSAFGNFISGLFDKDKRDLNDADAFAEVEEQLKTLYGRDLLMDLSERGKGGGGAAGGNTDYLTNAANVGTALNGATAFGNFIKGLFDKRDLNDDGTSELPEEVQDQLTTLLGRDLTLEERKFSWGKIAPFAPLAGLIPWAVDAIRGGGQQQQQQQQQQNGQQQNSKRDYQVTELSPEIQDQLQTLYGRDLTLEERALPWKSILTWAPLAVGAASAIFGNRGGDKKEENGKRDYQVTELSPEVQDQLTTLLGRDLSLEERGKWSSALRGFAPFAPFVLLAFDLIRGGGQQQQQQQQPQNGEQQNGQQQNSKRDGQATELSPEVEDQLKTLFGRDLSLDERGLSSILRGVAPFAPFIPMAFDLLRGGGQQQQQQQQNGQQQNSKRDDQVTELSPEVEDQLKTLFGRDLTLEERKINWGGIGRGIATAAPFAPLIPWAIDAIRGGGQQQQNGKRDYQVTDFSPEFEDQLKAIYGRDLTVEERGLGDLFGGILKIFGLGKRDFQDEDLENELKTLFGRDLALEERKFGGLFNLIPLVTSLIPGLGGNDKRDFQAEDLENELKTLFGRDLNVDERRLGSIIGNILPLVSGIIGGLGGGNDKRDFQSELSPEVENELKTLFGRDLTVEERGLGAILGPLLDVLGLGDGNSKRDFQAEDLENELKTLFGRDLNVDERGLGSIIGHALPFITSIIGGFGGGNDKRDFQAEDLENELKTLFGRDLNFEERGLLDFFPVLKGIFGGLGGGNGKRAISPDVEEQLETLFGRGFSQQRWQKGSPLGSIPYASVPGAATPAIPWWKYGVHIKSQAKRGYEDWENELSEQLRAGFSARGLNALD